MNISSMVFKIGSFEENIVGTGFLRDIQEYITALGQPQNNQNIILLKDIIAKVIEKLIALTSSNIPEDIDSLIVNEAVKKFSTTEYLEKMRAIENDPQMTTAQIYANLNQYLNSMYSELIQIKAELKKVYDIVYPYYIKDKAGAKDASLSLIFKDEDTIYNLKQFGRTMTKWNRALGIFSQLVSSESQKDIELSNIQNGSLDVILNINVDIAMNFAEIVKYALVAFGGYLSYKKAAIPIIRTYLGNKKLIESEKEREKLMLENIGIAVKSRLQDLHKERAKIDSKINRDSIDKKIDEVGGLITEHIIKGNDIRLLIDFKDVEGEEGTKRQATIDDVKRESMAVNANIKELSAEDNKLLLEMYKTPDD